MPTISVVVTTRDRGERVTETVRTALGNSYPHFDLTIVDQSEGDRTELALERYLGDPRVRYLRSRTRGLTSGRNRGISEASGELIALTDDDCAVADTWVQEVASAFAVDTRVGVVFGNVVPGPHDRRAGFVPGYVRNGSALARGPGQKARVEGMGACMAVRRATWEALGGFDEMLGAGAPLKAGDEGDLAIRALRAGYSVYETPQVAVVHHGFRRWKLGGALIHDYWFGTGAVFAKHLRCGERALLPLLTRLACRWAWGRSPVAASLGPGRHRALRLASFVQGLLAGATAPVDCRTGHFLDQGARDQEPARLRSHPHG